MSDHPPDLVRFDIEKTVSDYLYMQWLRPENIPWDVHAALLAAPYLRTDGAKAEIGIGNGYTTFMALGGRFRPEYDWYFNTDIEGFWQNRDIYDVVSRYDLADFIAERPRYRLDFAVDHKESLITQARQLDLADDYLVADANRPLPLPAVDTIFSNMLYWLDGPVGPLRRISDAMQPGARLVAVFPNRRYREYCRSFGLENRFWTLINRGRADCNFWSIDLEDLAPLLARETELTIERQEVYLSRQTLSFNDIGLRPISPYLIKMANTLAPTDRFAIKQEWCEGLTPLITECMKEELANGPREGGFNFVVLRKG